MTVVSIIDVQAERMRKIRKFLSVLGEVAAKRSQPSSLVHSIQSTESDAGWEENFQPNHFYGVSTIMRTLLGGYVGPLPLIFPHMIRDYRRVWSLELILQWPIAAYSDYAYWTYLGAGNRFGARSSAFLCRNPMSAIKTLLREHFALFDLKAASSSAVYFPDHSTGRIKGKLPSIESYKVIANEMRQQFDKIAICIYHLDLDNYIRRDELRHILGIFDSVLCCGDRHEPDFLAKLAGIFMDYPNVYVENLGSVVYFAECWGCTILWQRSRGIQLYSENHLSRTGSDAKSWRIFDEDLEKTRVRRLDAHELSVHNISRHPQVSRFINVCDDDCELKEIFSGIDKATESFLSADVLRQIHQYVE